MIDAPIVPSNGRERGPIRFCILGQRDALSEKTRYWMAIWNRERFHTGKRPLVADLISGAGVALAKNLESSSIFVTRTRELDWQKDNDQFGWLTWNSNGPLNQWKTLSILFDSKDQTE